MDTGRSPDCGFLRHDLGRAPGEDTGQPVKRTATGRADHTPPLNGHPWVRLGRWKRRGRYERPPPPVRKQPLARRFSAGTCARGYGRPIEIRSGGKDMRYLKLFGAAAAVAGAVIVLMNPTTEARAQDICKSYTVKGGGQVPLSYGIQAATDNAWSNWRHKVRQSLGSNWLLPCRPWRRNCWQDYHRGKLFCTITARPGALH